MVFYMSIQVSTRIDKETKQQFDSICDELGISPSNALSMFIKGVINHNGIPFAIVSTQRTTYKRSRESVFGCMRDQFQLADDFDAPLEDFGEYMQ